MIGERVGTIAAFDDPVSMGLNSWSVTLSRPVRGTDDALYLDLAAEYIAAAEQPWPELLSAGDAVGARAKTRMNPMYVMTGMIYPLFSHAAHAFTRTEINRRLMIVAIALERYRRHKQRPADDLAALVPEYLAKLPDDPTSGQPFRYKASEAGYVVFSPTERFFMASNEHPDAETAPIRSSFSAGRLCRTSRLRKKPRQTMKRHPCEGARRRVLREHHPSEPLASPTLGATGHPRCDVCYLLAAFALSSLKNIVTRVRPSKMKRIAE